MVAAAQALGALVPARHWLPLAAQAAGARGAAPEARACALVVLSALLYGAGACLGACVSVLLVMSLNQVQASGASCGLLLTPVISDGFWARHTPAPV